MYVGYYLTVCIKHFRTNPAALLKVLQCYNTPNLDFDTHIWIHVFQRLTRTQKLFTANIAGCIWSMCVQIILNWVMKAIVTVTPKYMQNWWGDYIVKQKNVPYKLLIICLVLMYHPWKNEHGISVGRRYDISAALWADYVTNCISIPVVAVPRPAVINHGVTLSFTILRQTVWEFHNDNIVNSNRCHWVS